MRVLLMPRSTGLSENPYPGSDGTTTSKESLASPPWAAGSVSMGMIFSISTTEPGQPWEMTSGNGDGPLPRAWMKWTPRPSTLARKWSNWLSARSCVSPVVLRLPVPHQFPQVGPVRAVVPSRAGDFVGPAGIGQPRRQVVQHGLGDVYGEGLDFHE